MSRLVAFLVLFALLGAGCGASGPASSGQSAMSAGATVEPTPGSSPTTPPSAGTSASAPAPTAAPSRSAPASAPPGSVLLAYEDTAQVEIVSPGGQRVLIDVWNNDLLSRPPHADDVLLTTHRHDDHYLVQWVAAFPGRTITSRTGHLVAGDVTITSIAAAHNEGDPLLESGGTDYLFLIEVAGLRIAHLGDLGEEQLSAAQLKALGRVDIVLSQLTNQFSDATLDNRKGIHLVAQLKPRLFIPTHILEDTVAEVRDVASVWPPVYSTARWLTLSPDTLPASTQVLFLGSDAPIYAKLSSASPFGG
jgi:Beta-lactamase superfamily domain